MRVSIAGAGLMGRMIGYRLQRRGWDVTLYERAQRDQPRSAAHVAAAMLATTSELPEADPDIHRLRHDAMAAWPALLEDLGVAHGLTGALLVAHGPDAPLLDKFHRSLGAVAEDEARWLDRSGVETLEPALGERFHRGLYLPNEGWLDNRALLAALEARCGTINYGCEVDPQQLEGDLVIDCRGTGADHEDLRGVRGEVIRLRAPEVRISRPVRLMHPRYQLYIVPRPHNEYVIGATQLESESTNGVSVRSALELLSAAFAVHTGFGEAEVLELDVGLRPAFPDNAPRVEWHAGVLSVNGLFRHGYLVAPAVVDQVENEIMQTCQGAAAREHDATCKRESEAVQ